MEIQKELMAWIGFMGFLHAGIIPIIVILMYERKQELLYENRCSMITRGNIVWEGWDFFTGKGRRRRIGSRASFTKILRVQFIVNNQIFEIEERKWAMRGWDGIVRYNPIYPYEAFCVTPYDSKYAIAIMIIGIIPLEIFMMIILICTLI